MSLSDDDRKNLLRKYDEYVLNGLSHSDAGKKVGRSCRVIRLWRQKFNQPKLVRKSKIYHIEKQLIEFIKEEYEKGGRRIVQRVIIKKAEDMCDKYRALSDNAKQQLIKRLMKKVRIALLPPWRVCSGRSIKNKLVPCKGIDCDGACFRKGNCPRRQMVERVFKKVVVVDKKEKGKGVVIDEVCREGDFIIEYVGKWKWYILHEGWIGCN